MLILGLFGIRGYAIEDDAVVVKHFLWQRRFSLAELETATLDPGALVGSIRTFGIGGVFGYMGRFRNRQLGGYLAYVTDGTHAVVLRFRNKILVISPEDHVGFLEQLLSVSEQ